MDRLTVKDKALDGYHIKCAENCKRRVAYCINKHADSIIERLDKLLTQTDDDDRLKVLAEADKEGR